MKPRVFVHGCDGTGWSTDQDWLSTRRFLAEAGVHLSGSPWLSNTVHSVWWTALFSRRRLWLPLQRRVLATASNYINPSSAAYQAVKKQVSLWVAPSRSQEAELSNDGVEVAYQPFFVDETCFCPAIAEKMLLFQEVGLDARVVGGRKLIGSFQRDTLGSDLKTPKWQKGPEILIDLLKQLPCDDSWLLLLAGPRRHYVIQECKRHHIPYLYLGVEPGVGVDDYPKSILSQCVMAKLYQAIDLYLVTSRSEGGPKAILESALTGTPILSTAVGLAPDVLPESCLFQSADEGAAKAIAVLAEQEPYANSLWQSNRATAMGLCGSAAVKERWAEVYRQWL